MVSIRSQYVLFPQQTGKLQIPSITYTGVIEQPNQNIDPFDAFFGGGNRLIEVKKTIEAPSITLQVEPLPERPNNFSGAVGQFSIASELTPRSLKANEAINMKVTVTGTGNMKLLGAPEVKFPKDFEAYKPKVTDDTKLQKGGASGSKTFDYVAVPRHAGKYQGLNDFVPMLIMYFQGMKIIVAVVLHNLHQIIVYIVFGIVEAQVAPQGIKRVLHDVFRLLIIIHELLRINAQSVK